HAMPTVSIRKPNHSLLGTRAMTHEHQAVPSTPPIDDSHVEKYRRPAIAASGIACGLDGFTWTMYGFALTAAMPVLGMSAGASGWVTAISTVASAAGGVISGNLSARFGRINMVTVVILGYSIFTALTAASQHTFDFPLWRTFGGLFF